MPQRFVSRKTPAKTSLFFCLFLVGGWVYDLFPVCSLMFFVDWLVSTLISMSHYPLEYSGGMFPLAAIPIIIIYHMVHDFQVSGSTSAFLSFFFFFKVVIVTCEACRFFSRASVPKMDPKRRITVEWEQRGQEGWGWRKLERSTQNVLNQILAPGSNCPATVPGLCRCHEETESLAAKLQHVRTSVLTWNHILPRQNVSPRHSRLMIVLFARHSETMSLKNRAAAAAAADSAAACNGSSKY